MSKMKLEHILLGQLIEHPRTGYEIKRFMDTHGRFLRANTQMSQVYRALTQLSTRGWATYEIAERAGAQDAKVYRATSEGETVFLDWLTSAYTPSTALPDPEFRGRIHFAGFLSRSQLIDLLEIEIEGRRRQVSRYRLRDRSNEVLPDIGFDMELDLLVSERMHQAGAAAMDQHIASIIELRDMVMELPLDGSGSERTASLVAVEA